MTSRIAIKIEKKRQKSDEHKYSKFALFFFQLELPYRALKKNAIDQDGSMKNFNFLCFATNEILKSVNCCFCE